MYPRLTHQVNCISAFKLLVDVVYPIYPILVFLHTVLHVHVTSKRKYTDKAAVKPRVPGWPRLTICLTEKGRASLTLMLTSSIWEAISRPCLVPSNLVISTSTVMYLHVQENIGVKGRSSRRSSSICTFDYQVLKPPQANSDYIHLCTYTPRRCGSTIYELHIFPTPTENPRMKPCSPLKVGDVVVVVMATDPDNLGEDFVTVAWRRGAMVE